jgi:hypothetical protein
MEPFGIGHLFLKPPGAAEDYVELMVLQECSWDFKFDTKELHGAFQFPVSVKRGKGSIDGTARAARLRPEVWGGIFNYDYLDLTAGQEKVLQTLIVPVTGTGTSADITLDTGQTFVAVLGVWYTDSGANLQLKKVTSSPQPGEYLATNTGTPVVVTIEVDASDENKTLLVDLLIGVNDFGSTSIPIINQEMGVTPVYAGGVFYATDNTRQLVLTLERIVATGLKFATKIDDWVYQDLPMKAFPNCAGQIGTIGLAAVEEC